MTIQKWVHDPFNLGNDSIFQGSCRLQVPLSALPRTREFRGGAELKELSKGSARASARFQPSATFFGPRSFGFLKFFG